MTTARSENRISTLIISLLAVFITIGVAQITMSVKTAEMVRQNTERIQKINDDYTPLFVMQALIESNDLMMQEVVGIKEADQAKIKEVQRKYAELQKSVINHLSTMRGGKIVGNSYNVQ